MNFGLISIRLMEEECMEIGESFWLQTTVEIVMAARAK